MSFKYAVEQVSSNHYVLPKVADMRCEVHAYLSEALYEASEEAVWSQAASMASYEGVIGAYLQPDTHSGFGIPIGGVVVTEGTIIQAGSGYDISCGLIAMKIPDLHPEKVASWDKREAFVREVEKNIGMGIGVGSKLTNSTDIIEVLKYGAKAIGIESDLCERHYIPVVGDYDLTKISKAFDKARPQLGSVGSGNHFVSMEIDDKTGDVFVLIHCGSRKFGWETANHFFYEGARLRGLRSNRREDSWLYMDEPLGKEYWAYHNAAANYAIANRHVIAEGINTALNKVWKVQGELYYEISHNLVQEETLVLPDGTTKKGFVHRKGATRAFPAGHPDLIGTRWEKTGHPCIIPGDPFKGSAILFPGAEAYKNACSVNHGSGRVLARGDAKRKLSHKQEFIDDEMRNIKRKFAGIEIRGVVGNYKKTPLDECSAVYKDLDSVLSVLKNENIANVAYRLWPVVNLKGTD